MMVCVMNDGPLSEAFTVPNGVKLGCVLASTLFNHMFSVMLMDAYLDERPRFRMVRKTDDYFINSRSMKISTPLSATTIHDPISADDYALNPATEADMQRSMNLFVSGCANFWLTTNTDKTMVTYHLPLTLHTMFLASAPTVPN
ncbi:hypothetical protein SprV_0401506500 [Sparganum proliferum]